jgi:5-amino-6-(5-phosphoribosylamino)uracil reductase
MRPFVLCSAAMSIDGFIDDTSSERLVLSDAADLDRVDAVRASVDAILVGANTIRRDDPRLLVRSERRQAERLARGESASPIRVTITSAGDLDPGARFFTVGGTPRIVYCPDGAAAALRERLADRAEVVAAGPRPALPAVLADLDHRGVRRLMVEGGTSMHTQFLAAGLVDELHLVVAPFLVGEPNAPRFVDPAAFPQNARHRMRLVEATPSGDLVLLVYRPEGARE